MGQRVERISSETSGFSKMPETTPGLSRGLQILEALACSKRGFTLSELALRLGIPKTTTHRLLCTLQASAYVYCEDASRRFFVSEKVTDLSRLASHSRCCCTRTYMILRELRRKSSLNVHFGILEDDEVIVRARLKSATVRKDAYWVGKHVEMHASGLGKAILAYLPDPQVDLIVAARGLSRLNANTISSREQLKEHLKTVRYRGFALDNEEAELGCRRVAAPVFHGDGCVAAAVDLAGTAEQITSENLASLADLVKQGAQSVSELNYS